MNHFSKEAKEALKRAWVKRKEKSFYGDGISYPPETIKYLQWLKIQKNQEEKDMKLKRNKEREW